jgi:hypothetical protein
MPVIIDEVSAEIVGSGSRPESPRQSADSGPFLEIKDFRHYDTMQYHCSVRSARLRAE